MENIDVAFDADSETGATGVVIRDSGGGFIAGRALFLEHVLDAPMAEAYALREGLFLAQLIGSNRFIIQSDCAEVVQTMQEGDFSATSAMIIYEECYSIWRDLAGVSIEFCHREANSVAHKLARDAFISKFHVLGSMNPLAPSWE
ncbi:hypothetical protein QOZ80_3AG0242440 [Eleusine coracana subsp. coracana]|nr:hypothetical protein QOZ80_3AG0242440 [Eleusine coracana subsp. coracana]